MPPVSVIVCGSRDWQDGEPVARALTRLAEKHHDLEIIHGGARGADAIADAIARRLGLRVRPELADWKGKGRGAGPERNRRMLALHPALVLGFKDGAAPTLATGGTENMLRIALQAGVPAFLFAHASGWKRLGT